MFVTDGLLGNGAGAAVLDTDNVYKPGFPELITLVPSSAFNLRDVEGMTGLRPIPLPSKNVDTRGLGKLLPLGPKYPPSMVITVSCDNLPCTTSSGTEAIVVGRTGKMLNVPVPVAEHWVPAARPLHFCAGSAMVTVTGPELARSLSLKRSRAPVDVGVVVLVQVDVVVLVLVTGKGNRTLV